ncbi:ABC transporter permease [Candidatus Latescibacterota bacterium]
MRKSWAIYLRELKSYFSMHIIYVIAVVFVLIIGNIFRISFFQFASRSMEILRMTIQFGYDTQQLININGVSLAVFNYINFLLLLITPLLTMRLYAEEKRNGTMELLVTSPITTTQVLLGKFFSCMTIYSILLALTVVFMFILAFFSKWTLDPGPVISSYIGTLLLGMSIIPIGMFFSSLTENQIVAAFTSLSTLFALWILLISSRLFSYPFNEVISYISIAGHQDTFKLGLIGIKDIFYYVTVSIFWLVLTWMSVESARWRQ